MNRVWHIQSGPVKVTEHQYDLLHTMAHGYQLCKSYGIGYWLRRSDRDTRDPMDGKSANKMIVNSLIAKKLIYFDPEMSEGKGMNGISIFRLVK